MLTHFMVYWDITFGRFRVQTAAIGHLDLYEKVRQKADLDLSTYKKLLDYMRSDALGLVVKVNKEPSYRDALFVAVV
jgi:hypothetical protein